MISIKDQARENKHKRFAISERVMRMRMQHPHFVFARYFLQGG